jgi:hypothetical protein
MKEIKQQSKKGETNQWPPQNITHLPPGEPTCPKMVEFNQMHKV